jgi:ribonuclease Z
MTPLLHPFLVNDRFGDPALYVDFKFEKRALLFDLGDLHALDPRKVLRLSDVFVSHAHLDHFVGFAQALRILLGRDKHLRLTGPAGFADRVEHALAAFSWNLVDRYSTELRLTVTEVLSGAEARRAEFRLKNAFRREAAATPDLKGGLVHDDETLQVRAAVLDHRIPCLAFAVQEKAHVNVWKDRLERLDLAVGPWLRELKRAVLHGDPDDTPIRAASRDGGAVRERVFPLGTLKREVLEIVPGQKIAYVVDALYSEDNVERIVALARGADILFVEAAFAREDGERAADRYHLTSEQAGRLGRLAGVRRLEPFHFSPRYAGQEARLRREVEDAFEGPRP